MNFSGPVVIIRTPVVVAAFPPPTTTGDPVRFSSLSLEREACGNLYSAVSCGTARDERIQATCLERRNISGVNVSTRSENERIRMVEYIERVRSDRQLIPFGEANGLHQTRIYVPDARAAEAVSFRHSCRKLIVVATAGCSVCERVADRCHVAQINEIPQVIAVLWNRSA